MAKRFDKLTTRQSKTQSKKQWRGVLRAWKKSGLSGAAFCRKNRLGLQSLYAWRRRLAGPKAARPRGREAFVPVQVVTGGESGSTELTAGQPVLELVLKNGRVLRLYREMPMAALAGMAHALERFEESHRGAAAC